MAELLLISRFLISQQTDVLITRPSPPFLPPILPRILSLSPKNPEDYEITYSVGEYFHNIEKSPLFAIPYFEKCVLQIVNVLSDSSRDLLERSEAWEKLHTITAGGPERDGEQLLAVTKLLERREEGLSYLRNLLDSLQRRNYISTASLLVWADNVEFIGNHEGIEALLHGTWYESNPEVTDPEWIKTMDLVKIVIKQYINTLPVKVDTMAEEGATVEL